MIETQESLHNYVARFETFLEEQRFSAPWLTNLRGAAMLRFIDLGFPTRHDEEWRFSQPARITEKPFQLADWDLDHEWMRANSNAFLNFVSPYLMRDTPMYGLVLFHGSHKRPLDNLLTSPPHQKGTGNHSYLQCVVGRGFGSSRQSGKNIWHTTPIFRRTPSPR